MHMVLTNLLLGLLSVGVGIVLLRHHNRVNFTTLTVYYGLRLLGITVLIMCLGFPYPPDTTGYLEQARRVLGGEVPNLDFATPYGFFFNYVLSLGLHISNCGITILAFFCLGEYVGLLLLRQSLLKLFDPKLVNQAIILYATSPIIILNLWLGGQDEALQILLIGVLFYLFSRQREQLTIIASVVGLYVTKIFSLWLAAPFLMWTGKKYWLYFVFINALIFLCFHCLNIRYISLGFERASGSTDSLSTLITSGNIWYLFFRLSGHMPPTYAPEVLILLLFLGASLFCLGAPKGASSGKPDALFAGIILYSLIFNAFYKMTFSTYLSYSIPFLSLLMLKGMPITIRCIYLIWSLLSAIETSFCFRVLLHPMSPEMKAGSIVYEFLLVACSLVLLVWNFNYYYTKGFSIQRGFLALCGCFAAAGRDSSKP